MDLIQVKKFRKAFGKKVVHSDVNFSLHENECLGLIGGSGTGKSVLLRSLIGLEKPDSGQIIYGGNDITKFSEEELIDVRKNIAYAFQGGALFDSMTVFDNLAYPLREHTNLNYKEISEKIYFQLGQFGLADSELLFPGSLSGGMQKRVGLARAIILGPNIILYDEPTAGLDPYNTKKIEEMIIDLKSTGTSSILVTHDMPVAFSVCDRIAFLYEGTIKQILSKKDFNNKNIDNEILKFATGAYF